MNFAVKGDGKVKGDICERCGHDGPGFALGRQMTVEFYDCDPKLLADVKTLERVFLEAARFSGATVVESRFHSFEPQGVSGVVIVSESHFAVHAWPEHDYAAVDLFTCGEKVDFDKAVTVIARGIGCSDWVVSSLLSRGVVGSNGVERLVPVGERRDCRAFQLSWKRRFDQAGARAISASIDLYECDKFDFSKPENIVPAVGELLRELELVPAGEVRYFPVADGGDFIQPLAAGRLSGSVHALKRTLYFDLFVDGFFDPRSAAETALRFFGGGYYRLQPQVRE